MTSCQHTILFQTENSSNFTICCFMLQEATRKADSAELEMPNLAAKVEELAETLQSEEQVCFLGREAPHVT